MLVLYIPTSSESESVEWRSSLSLMDSSPQSASIEKIVLEYDKTVVYICFRDITHYYDRIWTEKDAHIQYNGARYGLLGSSIPIQGNGYKKFDRGEEIRYTITFERIPTTASTVTLN